MGWFWLSDEKKLERDIKKGKKKWGRQSLLEPVESKQVGTLSARVIRVDGTIEDLGVIAEIERSK